ncbi:hypothetical protein [Archangium violaceum]|uniref:hypothetical protein n=1 Tax=Archangium violaceum TaxID=83451 RepID=UPI0013631EB6|nr:hypothetical protein [Archangium violaceum]
MPSLRHEALLELFRNRPALAAELLRDTDRASGERLSPRRYCPVWWGLMTSGHASILTW